MIPLHKLLELPRPQRIRKAAKILGEAERRFAGGLAGIQIEAESLAGVLKLLARDDGFSPPHIQALETAAAVLSSGKDEREIRRALNSACYVLSAETGRYRSDWDFVESSGALDQSKRRPFSGMQVYLEDIRSPFNVGSMFRAAESFGAEKLWLSPLCADPRHKRAERTAMGCVEILPWERLSADPFAAGLPFASGRFFTLETGGIPLADFPFPEEGILIAGSEELGVSPQALAAADACLGRVSIPTRGAKGSLNVSVAFGIVMQAWAANLAVRHGNRLSVYTPEKP